MTPRDLYKYIIKFFSKLENITLVGQSKIHLFNTNNISRIFVLASVQILIEKANINKQEGSTQKHIRTGQEHTVRKMNYECPNEHQ